MKPGGTHVKAQVKSGSQIVNPSESRRRRQTEFVAAGGCSHMQQIDSSLHL